MAKLVSKGTAFQVTISSSLTTIAQLTSISMSGSGAQTFDSTTLDGGVYKTYDSTGYSEPGKVSIEGFYDTAAATHQAFTDLIDAPADVVCAIVYSNANVQQFTAVGFQMGVTFAMTDGVKFTGEVQIDGTPDWTT